MVNVCFCTCFLAQMWCILLQPNVLYLSNILGLADCIFWEDPTTTKHTKNNTANKIHQLKRELKSLKQLFKVSNKDKQEVLPEMHSILRKKLMTLRKERASKQAAFLANLFGFTK